MIRISLLIVMAIFIQSGYSAEVAKHLTLLASGETHGMALACDCPVEPGGGLAKRATIINDYRLQGDILVLDGGGFCAGGIYDPYSEGRKPDSIRSLATLRGMAHLSYDAIAVGDDDLQYGFAWLDQNAKNDSLPLISCNIFVGGKPAFATSRIVQRSGKRWAITAITTPEKLFAIDSSIIIQNPVSALLKIWKQMVATSDYQIILNHCGEEYIDTILNHFPEVDIIVNGHRKKSNYPFVLQNNTIITQFGFQGKQLSKTVIEASPTSLRAINSQWIRITPNIPDDSTVAAVINRAIKTPPVAVEHSFDLYMMSQCPYGIEALKSFCEVYKQIPSLKLTVWFIGEMGPDSTFKSLHGPAEVADELKWLGVKNSYPDRWMDFLSLRSTTPPQWTTDTIIALLKMDASLIQKWITRHGASELRMHYVRSTRQDIDASPTVLVNNAPFEYQISTERLFKNLCPQLADKKLRVCDSIPACLDNTDCKRKGKIGTCSGVEQSRHCVYTDPLRFTFTVLIAESTVSYPENSFIQTTIDLFPGAIIDTVYSDSKRCRELSAKYKITALPFFLFDDLVKKDVKYPDIASGLEAVGSKLVFKKGIIKTNYFINRTVQKSSVRFLIDPLYADAGGALKAIAESKGSRYSEMITPLLAINPATAQTGIERMRAEESLRWIVLHGAHPQIWQNYLKQFQQNAGCSSYWSTWLAQTPAMIDTLTGQWRDNGAKVLQRYYEDIKFLEIETPIAVLIDNKEVIQCQSADDLKSLLVRIK